MYLSVIYLMEETTNQESAPTQTLYFAGIGSRFLALMIDGIILLIIGSALAAIMSSINLNFVPFLNLIIGIAYPIYMVGAYGQTLGKMIMRIRIVKEDGTEPDYGTAAVRFFASFLSVIILYIGYIVAFFNPQHQTWHDKIARTYVITA